MIYLNLSHDMQSNLSSLLALALVSLLFACGEETVEERINRRIQETVAGEGKVDLDSLGERLRRAAEGIDFDSIEISGLDDVAVVPFRELKTVMPARIDGLPREAHFGETRKVLGVRYSVAEATYAAGDRRVDAKLTDAGGGGKVIRSLLGFSGFEVDKETAEGSERTFELDGHRAYVKVRRRDGALAAKLQVMVTDRFIVSLDGVGVEPEALTAAFRDFDLAALPTAPVEPTR